MRKFAILLVLFAVSGCAEEQPDRALALCQTAVKMSMNHASDLKWLAHFDATKLKEEMPHEARIGLPPDSTQVLGLTFSATAEDKHHDGQAYCGFRGTEDDLRLAHVVVDGRTLDSFAIDIVHDRFVHGETQTHEGLNAGY